MTVTTGTVEGLSHPVNRAESESKQMASGFEDLFLNHYPRIVGVLFRLLGDRTRAEELANDVFWRAYLQPSLRIGEGNVGGWLYRTATNLAIDALRADARRKQYERAAGWASAEARPPADPLTEVLRAEKRSRVRRVLASLKPAQAQILILRSSGCSYNELAEALGIQRGSVGTMLARAEVQFRRRYRQRYANQEGL